MEPVPQHRRARLKAFVDERIRPQIDACPHVRGMLQKIDEALSGSSFKASKAWQSEVEGVSYETWVSERAVARSISERVAVWRQQFQTKMATKLLGRKDGNAHISAPFNLTQQDIGRIAPPPLRDNVRSEEEMRSALIDHLVSVMTTKECKLVKNSDWRADELFILLFPQFKPEDLLHLDPRWCLNMRDANEPAKSVRQPKKKRSGHVGSRATTQTGDTAACFDMKKGYKQCGVDEESGRKQRHIVPLNDWLAACEKISQTLPERAQWPTAAHRRVAIAGVDHLILQPRTLQFGATESSDIFQLLLGLPITALRQAGIRLETQIDDVEIKSAFGPQTTYTELLIAIAYLGTLGWVIHVSEKKAAQLWPKSEWTFDGQLMRAKDLMTFTPADRDARHRTALIRFLSEQASGKSHTLRELAAITGQQQSNAETHWWTSYVIPQTVQHLAQQTRALAATHGINRAWERTIEPLPESAVLDLALLTTPRDHGEHMRTATGTATGIVNADASGYAIGYQALNLTTGKKIRGTLTMPESERVSVHHTVQECAGAARAAVSALRYLDIRGTESAVPSIVKVGNDNTAAIKNLNKPGGKPQMVEPTLELQIEARRRRLVVVAGYLTKHFMDRVTRIDFDSRPKFHMGDLGLNPAVLQRASSMLQISLEGVVDGAACRATRQPIASSYISRYPDSQALPQTDVRSYDLSNHKDLDKRLLYLFPPEVLIADLLMKLQLEPRRWDTLIVLPLWASIPNWWSLATELLDRYVTVPFNNELYVQPGAPEQIVDPVGWTLIIGLKYGTVSSCEEQTQMPPRSRYGPTWMGRVELPSYRTPSSPLTTINEERRYFEAGPSI